MKLLKKLSASLLILLISLTQTHSVFAQGMTIEDRLRELNIPQELINMMPLEQKEDILSQNLIFDSYQTVTYSIPNNDINMSNSGM